MKARLIAGAVTCAATVVIASVMNSWLVGDSLVAASICLLGVALPRLRLPWGQDPTGPELEQQAQEVVKSAGEHNNEPDGLVDIMLSQSRSALLLRPQIVGNLSPAQRARAARELDNAMALVPEGVVVMPCAEQSRHSEQADQTIFVEALLLDRFAVTNAQYKRFVDAGGYGQISFWDKDIMSGMLDFVDQSGHSGPAFWREGTYPADLENHPVVGICWYEAQAYSRWVGKRLPTDAEWVKAASWPVAAGENKPIQRAYPWGEAMDRNLANLWGSGPETTVEVDRYERGASVNGVYQMVGNVWEWMSCDLGTWDSAFQELKFDEPMKGIRGGAYDTYFDGQATCRFQSGDSLLARKHNIGFRCAVGLCDVTAADLLGGDDSDAQELAE